MSFKIVTDSTSDLPKGWVEEHGVDVLEAGQKLASHNKKNEQFQLGVARFPLHAL